MAVNSKNTKKRAGSKSTAKSKSSSYNKRQQQTSSLVDSAIYNEILLIVVFTISILLFLCNFGIIGTVGDYISNIMFGIFGLMAFAAPILLFLVIAFGVSNKGNTIANIKIVAGILLFFLVGVVFELSSGRLYQMTSYSIGTFYKNSSTMRNGGGVLSGSLAYLLYHFMDMVGTILVVMVLIIICLVAITEKSILHGVKNGSAKVYSSAMEEAENSKERAARRKEESERRRQELEVKKSEKIAEKEAEKIFRMDKKVQGVMIDTTLSEKSKENTRDDIHEIILNDIPETASQVDRMPLTNGDHTVVDFDKVRIRTAQQPSVQEFEPIIRKQDEQVPFSEPKIIREKQPAKKSRINEVEAGMQPEVHPELLPKGDGSKKYQFPPISLLQKAASKNSGDSTKELKETAIRLQQTLNTFGVKVTITDISQGPSVTRYELQPEVGVKVSKIVGLADDIKLNLAATDIRIEAPIPGKAAVGIEVPNKENTSVGLRELLESKEFHDFNSNIAFAVGKDIGGQVVVSDIAKMPHMLIAGATGSGKSVCINTIIMSILFKASPDDVKLIMIDPKVVELSVYNGIPHLMVPVVTDPKKAAAALHWGVAEMQERYRKFADYNVRDLKGFNKKVESMRSSGDETERKLPQVVIIVDELADLMMVSPGEVEESICRLAQLARAAGIHLIIATQRPSVDVITGLIKANMPSRVAFSVSSGVDSRTILDMNGAEKLLGKGDMLFYPQGLAKPARIQGAFVSDKEVFDVVDFLKNQTLGNVYQEDVEEKIQNIGLSSTLNSSSNGDGMNERDSYFEEAGKFIIEKEKASIGMLQRVFKIGFNRAARIMDQLAEAGVVGEEDGTKPRKVLMSQEQFEQYIEECL